MCEGAGVAIIIIIIINLLENIVVHIHIKQIRLPPQGKFASGTAEETRSILPHFTPVEF